MTITESILQTDAIRPNSIDEDVKTTLLNQLDNRIRANIWLCGPNDFMKYKWPEDKDRELIVQEPFDDLYVHFLCSRIDYMTENYESYQNTHAMFETKIREYTRWFAENYEPALSRGVSLVGIFDSDDTELTWVLPQEAILTRLELVIEEPFEDGTVLLLDEKELDASDRTAYGFPMSIVAGFGGEKITLKKDGESAGGRAVLYARALPFLI